MRSNGNSFGSSYNGGNGSCAGRPQDRRNLSGVEWFAVSFWHLMGQP